MRLGLVALCLCRFDGAFSFEVVSLDFLSFEVVSFKIGRQYLSLID